MAYANIKTVKPGDFVTLCFYTDRKAYTVLSVGKNSVVVQEANQKLADDWKPEIVEGGFVGHCTNQDDQRWEVTPNPDAQKERWYCGKDGRLRGNGSRTPNVIEGACPFHDYNF